MLSARYLGPSGYGLINYAASLVAFFVPIMQLGLNATLVQEIVSEPDREGETMGTAMAMTFVSSIACIIGVAAFSAFANRGETQTILVCALYSFLLMFQSLEMIQYWFQAKLKSKYTSLTILAAYIMISAYRIFLLANGYSLYWYAISQAIDFAIIAAVLFVIYHQLHGQRLRVSWKLAGQMLGKSKYYIVSALMVTIFGQTDRVMLKLMIDEAAVGFYSAAVGCAGLTSFVFVAIIDSARPSILKAKDQSANLFCQRMKTLCTIIIYLALAQSVAITALARIAVKILYGSEYEATIPVLRIIVWYTTFSYLGAVRDIWILANGKQKYLPYINLSGASLNVAVNFLLIPRFGAAGAAFASLATQIFTNFILSFWIKPIRETGYIMLASFDPREAFKLVKHASSVLRMDRT